jgi:hypothetical protein
MKKLLIILILLFLPLMVNGALDADIVWEFWSNGALSNGGGFKTGASGTDWKYYLHK